METKELQIHDFQISILKELLFKPDSRFTEIKKINVENDHFSFHIRKLVEEGLILKSNGKYSLTQKGKEFANRMDTDALTLEKQAKLAVAIHAVRIRNGREEYLMHHRLKEPFYGWWGSHSGKIKWGETPLTAAKRELLEESGLTGDFFLKGLSHYHHFHKNGQFLEDKYFFVFKVTNTKGKLQEKVNEGENIWLTESQIKKIKNIFANISEMKEVLDSKKFLYVERKREVESY